MLLDHLEDVSYATTMVIECRSQKLCKNISQKVITLAVAIIFLPVP
jgi:hypothetical protein